MRLERIVLDGFKSFADKTEFVFDSSVTGIVGPNGCGKSNVVDAVKWVLGEQSVKSLRSGQMADVIFGGSSGRKSAASAEVSLVLSNSSGRLPIEAEHVQITRRVYKSGDSQYLINNKACRLKDVRELLMDTGIGAKAYSIIEQGQVEQLVTASKADRRALIEEASGISKYKAHKKEAMRKLERTEQNLLRLADVLSEVQKNLRSIKVQAGRARSYLEYTERFRSLQAGYYLAEYHGNHTETQENRTVLDCLERDLAEVAAKMGGTEAEVVELGRRIADENSSLAAAGNAVVAVQGKIDQKLQRIELLNDRLEELDGIKTRALSRIGSLKQQYARFRAELDRCRNELNDSLTRRNDSTQAVETLQQQIGELSAGCETLQADLEDEKSGIIDMVRRTAQLHNEIQSISVFRTSLTGQKDRLSSRADAARRQLEELLTEKARHQARLSDIETVLSDLESNLQEKRSERDELAALITEDTGRLAAGKESKGTLAGELAVLEDMEARREGLDAAVREFLASLGPNELVDGILADAIETDVRYAAAVEAALENLSDAVLVNGIRPMLSNTSWLSSLQGRVRFICTDSISPFCDTADLSGYPAAKGRLAEFVRCHGRHAAVVWALLGRTILIDDLESAVELRRCIGADYDFVTMDGCFLGSDGTVRVGPAAVAGGLISRKSRLVQIKETVTDIERQLATLDEQVATRSRQRQHLEKLCKDLRTAVYEANTERTQARSQLEALDQQITRLSGEQPLLAGEIEQLETQIADSVSREYESKQKLQELETVNAQRTEHIEQLETQYQQQKDTLDEHSDRLADLRVTLGQAVEQCRSLEAAISSLDAQICENRSAGQEAEDEITSCTVDLESARADILACEAAVSDLFAEKDRAQEQTHIIRGNIQSLTTEHSSAQQKVRGLRDDQAQIEQRISDVKVAMGRLEVSKRDLIEKVREQLEVDLEEAYAGYTEGQTDWEAVRDEIQLLREKIQRLGNVNVDAIGQEDSLQERHDFLSVQVEDLNNGRAQLENLINRLNRTSREKFIITFELVRENFQQVFRKLFGGGRADIVLEDAEDVLEAGIEIVARPPGKETRSISLLSGGEKSMTAIALLFAVFQAKPSPFCFLDEVDAALDEANTERFGLLIRQFQGQSQFIVITHSKRTMSIADTLFGVTMQTRGVSKKISVTFDQAEEPAAA